MKAWHIRWMGWALLLNVEVAWTGATAAPPVDRVPLPSVLGVLRPSDQDWLFLRDGTRQAGRFLEAALELHTACGEIRFPVEVLSGLDLSDDRAGLAIVVTESGDRFTGFLAASELPFQPITDVAPHRVRSGTVLKAVWRRRVPPGDPPAPAVRVRLRQGDCFTGRLLTDRFRVEPDGSELGWAEGQIRSAVFPHSGHAGARLHLANGDTIPGSPLDEDLRFQLSWGQSLVVYAGRVDEISVPEGSDLPADWAARIGAVNLSAAGTPAAQEGPEAAVIPRPGMVWLPPGEFTMGSPPEERERDLDEGPLTRVVFSEGFWMGRHEVTQAEYLAVMGNNPSQYAGQAWHPVERVNWQEAKDYCRRLTESEQAAGQLPAGYRYRLPTEAEWEYACRAGTSTRFSFGDDFDAAAIRDHAWFSRNADSATHPVGTRRPNPWGLFDLHGNVLEWCLDGWNGPLPGGRITHTVIAPEGTLRAVRGGSWLYEARHARSANRDSYSIHVRCSDLGFRLVLARDPHP